MMHGTYFVLLNIAGIVVIWVVVLLVISRLGGWALLAEQYRCLEPFSGPCWNFQCGQFRWFASYNNCLTVGADPRGLFLRIFPLFRVAHPPLFIPWREISVSRHKVLWIKQVQFRLGHELQVPLTIRDGLAQKLQSAAGSSWPVEPVSSG
jgi:hypothetical protein